MRVGKDTQSSMQAYVALLEGLKVGETFFNVLNEEFTKLVRELFRILVDTNQLDRKEEFLDDFRIFSRDMLIKYSTNDQYTHSPRSAVEKRLGIAPQYNRSRKPHLKNNCHHRDDDGYIF